MTEWIKCSDKLPKTIQRALVYDAEIKQVMIATYFPLHERWHWDEEVELGSPYITYWMALPNTPKDLK